MIHYHGTPIGGSRQDVARFLVGRHALVPFFRQDDMGIVADVCQSFVLDNSAYSIWKSGGEMDYKGYLDFVETWRLHPSFDWAIIPDVIDGDEHINDKYLEMWETKAKGVPVYHMHESLERLKRLCDTYETVALGGSHVYPTLSSSSWWKRIGAMFNYICDNEGRPPCRLHGLRMLNPEVFTKLPLSSADSVNAGRNSCMTQHFGRYVPPTAAQRTAVIADRIEQHNSAALWQRNNQASLFNYENLRA